MKNNSSFPGPLGGVCRGTRSKWFLIPRELCLPTYLVNLYWTKPTPLLTRHFYLQSQSQKTAIYILRCGVEKVA